MLHSVNAPCDDNNTHLRRLIDQRNARANVHGRLSVVSRFSDAPSVYSQTYFPPTATEIGEFRVGYNHSSSISDLGTRRYEPQTSILDLTDEQPHTYAPDEYDPADTSSSEISIEGGSVRMSYLGPKMRVHSRAPWEEEALEEIDENVPNFSFSRKRAKSIASSPRPSLSGSASRKSGDSSMSQIGAKRSFETVNSQMSPSHSRGGLYSLARESVSSNSLGRRTPGKETFLNKLSGRLRSEAPTTINNMSPVSSPISLMAKNLIPTSASRDSSILTVSTASSGHDTLEPPSSVRKAPTHPYANPDLLVSYPENGQELAGSLNVNFTALSHSDSTATVRDPIQKDLTLKYTPQSRASLPDTSAYPASKTRAPPISTRNISSPISVIASPQMWHAERNLPGWTERSSASPFALISLEEARAKHSTDSASNTILYPNQSPSSPLATFGSRVRGRSVSAGANALHHVPGRHNSESQNLDSTLKDDLPSGKTLKNKKSGFMKIFNRDKDFQNVPPVPSLPDEISQFQHTQRLTPSPSLDAAFRNPNLTVINTNMKPSLFINTATQNSPRATKPNTFLGVPPQSAPANLPEFPVLKLRPVSTLFSASFGDLVPSDPFKPAVQETSCSPSSSTPTVTTPTSLSGPLYGISSVVNDETHPSVESQLSVTQNAWQKHVWELESQVRRLKAELGQLKSNDGYCDKCGRGRKPPQNVAGAINRPRARTGSSYRLVNPSS